MSDIQPITPPRTLRSIVDAIIEELDLSEGECTPNLDALQLSLNDKVQAYEVVYHQLQAESDAFAELRNTYAGKCMTRVRQALALKARLLENMQALGTDKIKTPTTTASIKRATHVEVGEDFVTNTESRFVRTCFTQSPDKTKIREALEQGEDVPGASLVETQSVIFR